MTRKPLPDYAEIETVIVIGMDLEAIDAALRDQNMSIQRRNSLKRLRMAYFYGVGPQKIDLPTKLRMYAAPAIAPEQMIAGPTAALRTVWEGMTHLHENPAKGRKGRRK